MAFHTKKQFAALCGLQTKHLSTLAARRKIVFSGDLLDDTIEPNKSFIKHKLAVSGNLEQGERKAPNVQKPVFQKEKVPKISEPEQEFNASDLEIQEGDTLETQKLKVDIANKLEALQEKKLKNLQTMGKVIPTELVKSIFVQHSQSITTEFKNAADDIVRIMAKKKEFSEVERAEINGQLVTSINVAIEKAIALSIKNLDNITENYELQEADD